MNNTSIPAPLFSTNVSDTVKWFQGTPVLHNEIVEYGLSLFHLTVGLVPSRMPMSRFLSIRHLFLESVCTEDKSLDVLNAIPPFILLHSKSSSEDVKDFLVNCGVPESKVLLLPSTLTFQDFKDGKLGPALEDDDLKKIQSALFALLSLVQIFKFKFTKESIKLMEEAFSKLYRHESQLIAEMANLALLCPKTIVPYITIEHVSDNDDDLIPERISYPDEFNVNYSNFDAAIQKGIVPELAKLFSKRKRTNKFGSQNSYSPIVHLTNCSGSGKTRACLELGRMTNVLFFKFGGSNGLEESIVGREIITFLHNLIGKHRVEYLQIMNAIIMRILYMCGELFERDMLEDSVIIIDQVVKTYFVEILGQPNLQEEGFAAQINRFLFEGLSEYNEEMNIKLSFDTRKVTKCMNPANLVWTIATADKLLDTMNIESSWLTKRRAKLQELKTSQDAKNACASLPFVLLVLDEAHSLMQYFNKTSTVSVYMYDEKATDADPGPVHVPETPVDVYRVIRSTIRYFQFYWSSSLTLTVSTVAKLEHFNPAPNEDPSYRPHSVIRLNNPIVLYYTYDCFRVGVFNELSRPDWMAFLFSRERFLHVGACGRPLWGLYFAKSACDEYLVEARKLGVPLGNYLKESTPSFNNVGYTDLRLAFFKLGNKVIETLDGRYKFDCPIGPYEAVALLGLAVGVQKYPKEIDISQLVQFGPFPIVDYNMAERTLSALACSEGVFNGAATLLLMEHLGEVADWLLRYISATNQSFFSQGEIGEIVDRIAVLKAIQGSSRAECIEMMRCRNSDSQYSELPRTMLESIMEPVGLEAFLCQYVGEEATEVYLQENPGLKGSFLGMSHFAYMGEDWVEDNPYDCLANALSRGMGIVPRAGSKGFDTIMPLVLSDGKLSFVYMQTKLSAWSKGLPKATVVRSSAPDTCLSNIDVTRPYCYIFRKLSNVSPRYHIYPAVEATVDSPGHQPCLAFAGSVSSDLPSKYQDLLDLYCIKKRFNFVKKNASLMSTWRSPDNVDQSIDSCKMMTSETEFEPLCTGDEWVGNYDHPME